MLTRLSPHIVQVFCHVAPEKQTVSGQRQIPQARQSPQSLPQSRAEVLAHKRFPASQLYPGDTQTDGDFGYANNFFNRHQLCRAVGTLHFAFTVAVCAMVVASLGNRNPKVKQGSAAVVH